jgi:hypothetical protein
MLFAPCALSFTLRPITIMFNSYLIIIVYEDAVVWAIVWTEINRSIAHPTHFY